MITKSFDDINNNKRVEAIFHSKAIGDAETFELQEATKFSTKKDNKPNHVKPNKKHRDNDKRPINSVVRNSSRCIESIDDLCQFKNNAGEKASFESVTFIDDDVG